MPCTDGGVPYETELDHRYDYLYSVAKALNSILNFKIPKKAINYNVSQDTIDSLVRKMCEFIVCGGLAAESKIYDGRNKNSRLVADWWDEHKEIDKLRKLEENKKIEQQKQKAARNKVKKEITEWFKVNSVAYPLSKTQWNSLNGRN